RRRDCAPGEITRRRSFAPSLGSAGVVRTLQRLERKPAIAFAYFKDTESIGFRHDLATYTEIIRVLSHKGQGRMLFSLFREILLQADGGGGGPEIVPLMDQLRRTCTTSYALLFATNSLITTCTSCCSAPDTIGLFGDLFRLGIVPSVLTCNILLKFAAESGDSEIVVSAYDQIKLFGLTLDAHSLGLITWSLFREKKADKAFQVWAEMIEMGVKPDINAYSSFIAGLCDCGKIDLAYAILQEISREGVQVEPIAYNMVMDGLSKEMRLQEVEMLLEDKTRQGFTPDIYGYSYLIRSYGKAGNLLKVLDHYQAMVSHGFETNCHIASYLLQCFTKLGMTSEVTEHFQKLRDSGLNVDGVLYNIAIYAYCKLGNMDEAVKLLREMKAEGLTPDRIHYTCVIKGYCLKGDVPNARQAFEVMLKANVKPDVVTYNILASGFCKNGLVTEVFHLLDHMADQGDGNAQGASTVCSMMLENNVIPDVISYSKLISAYCQTGDMHNACLWFHDMVQRGLSVDVIVYTVLMNGYCKVGQMEEACKLFDQMINLGIKPDVIAYTVLLDGHLKEYLQRCWQGVSKERRIYLLRAKQNMLLSSMKKMEIEPDVPFYTVLIDGQCKADFLEEARGRFDELLQKGLTPDQYVYTALISGYCSQGEIEKAQDLFEEMVDRGIKPDVLTFSVLNQKTLRERQY
uniref:Pentacotripeptide-repeat region of PRORP domain-containing protein n=1 Tax=Aegilops tauschii subsp. strangulata TaxID=200361 RepID=A0A453QZ45_AEGTS